MNEDDKRLLNQVAGGLEEDGRPHTARKLRELAERIGGVTRDLWPRLFDDGERDLLARQIDPSGLATILFSAKESCHKAGKERVLRFHDLRVTLDENNFTARRGTEAFQGCYAVQGDLVVTAAWRSTNG